MATTAESLSALWCQARGYLQDATTVPMAESLPSYSLRCRLWRSEIFSECRSWSVFAEVSSETSKQYLVRRVVWHQSADAERLSAAARSEIPSAPSEPTMSYTDGILSSSQFGDAMTAGMGIWIPVAGQNGHVWKRDLDCSGCETGYEEFGAALRLAWTGSGPESWRTFTEWAEDFIGLLDRACDAEPSAAIGISSGSGR